MEELLAPIVGIAAVIGIAAFSVIIVRFASVFAKRLEARISDVAPRDPAIGELREELAAMEERLDFLERALIAQRNESGRTLPAKDERADSTTNTPA